MACFTGRGPLSTLCQSSFHACFRVSQDVYGALPTINVTGYNDAYNGAPQTAIGTATAADGTDLSQYLSLQTTHTNAGTYYDTWTFSDPTSLYPGLHGMVTDTITQANATINMSGLSVAYNGSPQATDTGTAIGANGVDLSGDLNLGPLHTTAGTYTNDWSFTDTTGNYAMVSGTVTGAITKVTPTLTVTDSGGAYDGASYPATATINGGSSLEGVTPTIKYYYVGK